ncbi:sensor histidine kinase [Reichenbachiella sp.]|uniref:tetratricopeptide repeat-containing sensor histidine kinase n=1 Tax=Reichenbachiella sp. TaxID=2184521 RepID=UPI0032970F35
MKSTKAMFAPSLTRPSHPSRLRCLVILVCLLLTSFRHYGQSLESLTQYIETCETKTCLDTLRTLDLQAYLNEITLSKKLLKVALKKAKSIEHSKLLPVINTELARLFYYQGEIDSSFYYRIEGIKQFEAMNELSLAGREYAELGYQYKRINLEKGFKYMRLGVNMLEEINDTIGLANTYNNYGVLFEMKHKMDSALYYYRSSLELKEHLDDSLGIPYSLENIALIQLLNNEYNRAESNLKKALKYRVALNDQQGLLGNYINLAELYQYKNELRTSISYFQKALDKENEISQPYAAQYCYEKLTGVYRKQGNYQLALDSHINYTAIKDSLSTEQNVKNVERLTIQYETEKKEQEIELLSVENQLKIAEVKNANNRFYASLGGIGLIVLSVFLLFNRYQHQQRALLAEERSHSQKLGFKSLIEGEEKERKRIAQELHDGLGQLLSTARLNISAIEDHVESLVVKQWENSVKLIDQAVTEVRHISHNMMPNALISIGLEAAIKEQIHIINDAGKVQVHAEMPAEKINLPESEAIALYRVIQEVLNNALKYAEAENIWLKIKSKDQIQVYIKDDGKGFDKNLLSKTSGIGWRNIESRMEILNGKLDIQTELGKGSEISLKLAI